MSTVFRTNGGIINSVLKSGQLRFFKITGDFAWTMSDGTVNLPPQYVAAGLYSVVAGLQLDAAGDPIPYTGQPVPYSAAEYVLKALSEKCEIVGMSLVSGGAVPVQTDGVVNTYDTTSELHIACTTHNFGWGLAIDPGTGAPWVSAEAEMQAVVQALSPENPPLANPPFTDGRPPYAPPPPAPWPLPNQVDVFITAGAAVPPATQDSMMPLTNTFDFTTVGITEVQLVLV